MFKWLVFFSIFFGILRVDAFVNIHEQCYKRSQQYPINGYQGVVVLSPYRTGSTLVFNVLRFLFEDLKQLKSDGSSVVRKTHSMGCLVPSKLFFCTVRNPIDTCFSNYRVKLSHRSAQEINEMTVDETALEQAVDNYLSQMQRMHQILQRKRDNVVLLKYEDFDSNLEFIFAQIEEIFKIKISEKDRLLMEEAFSKENVAFNVKKYKQFSNYDKKTLFHGKHIEIDEFSDEKKAFIHEKIRQKLSGKCGFLIYYGYDLLLS